MKKIKLKLRRGVDISVFLLFAVCAVFSGVTFQDVARDIFNYRLEQAREQIGALKDEEKSYARALYLMHKGLYSEAHDEMSKSGAAGDDRWKEYISAMKEIGAGFESENIAGFNVRFYPRDKVMLPYLREKLPKINRAMKRIFAFSPDGVTLEIYPDRESFLKASTLSAEELERSGTVAIAKFSRLMILSPRLLPYGYRWDDTVCHEYIHHIVGNFTGMNIPLYLNEGIARTFETLWRKASPELGAPVKNQLARAKEEGFIEFKKFERGMPSLESQKDVALAFAEVNYLVYGMFESAGAKKIKQMLIGCGQEGFEKSFERYFGPLEDYMSSYWENMRANEWIRQGASPDFIYWKEDDDFLSLSIKDYMRLGDRLRSAGKYSLALQQYGKAEALEPENTLVLVKTAKTLAASGNREKAEEYFARAALIAEDDFVCLVSRADFFISGGRYEESAPLLLKALERNPFYRKGYEQLYDIYMKTGEKEKAAEYATILEML
ncbi:MAG: hypothetical protein Q7J59_00235 [Elusimicrobiota bacterium]|nr:hypothetical protein [Elusimicrobiota bacterium]